MRPDHLGRAFRTVDAHSDPVAFTSKTEAVGVQPNVDTLAFEDLTNGVGNVLVVTADQAWPLLEDGDAYDEELEGYDEADAYEDYDYGDYGESLEPT